MGIVEAKNRLKAIINKDQNVKSDCLTDVVKSDIIEVLQNYFVFENQNVKIEISQENGEIFFSAKVKCEKIKNLNYLK